MLSFDILNTTTLTVGQRWKPAPDAVLLNTLGRAVLADARIEFCNDSGALVSDVVKNVGQSTTGNAVASPIGSPMLAPARMVLFLL